MVLDDDVIIQKIVNYPLPVVQSTPPRFSCDSATHNGSDIREGQDVFAIFSEESDSGEIELEKLCCTSCSFQDAYESTRKDRNLYVIEAEIKTQASMTGCLTKVYVWDVYEAPTKTECP